MMPLRQAKKLVKYRRQIDTWAPAKECERRAIRRYLRWPGRHLAKYDVGGSFIGHYVLNRLGRPLRFTGDLLDWTLIHSIEHRVDYTELADGTCISTVFLGIDHNFGDMLHMRGGRHTPVLFESMVQLPEEKWDEQHRYTNLHDARVGHALLVARLSKPGETPPEMRLHVRHKFLPRLQKLRRRHAAKYFKKRRRIYHQLTAMRAA